MCEIDTQKQELIEENVSKRMRPLGAWFFNVSMSARAIHA